MGESLRARIGVLLQDLVDHIVEATGERDGEVEAALLTAPFGPRQLTLESLLWESDQ